MRGAERTVEIHEVFSIFFSYLRVLRRIITIMLRRNEHH